MNPKYILPAAFALSFHAWFLLGFPEPAQPERTVPGFEPVPKDTDPILIVDKDEPIPVTDPSIDPSDPVPPPKFVPFAQDYSFLRDGEFVIPYVAPPEFRGEGTPLRTIPPNWNPIPGSGRPDSKVVDSRFLDRIPRARVRTAPEYPYDEKHRGREGEVVVEFEVDESGRVISVRAISSASRAFEAAAVRAVARWQFEPGFRNNRIVRFRMRVPVVFSLTSE